MADPTELLDERIDLLLSECPPASSDPADFLSRQYDLGLGWVHFPEGRGGLGVEGRLQAYADKRLRLAGAPQVDDRRFFAMAMSGPTMVSHADDALLDRLHKRAFTGEDSWCQLFSEPGAGSDLAGLSARAVRDGDEWVINGQKVWNTFAHIGDRGMLVARTDPDVPKHKGLTYFALDMHAPGVEVRPLYQITGEAEFNEVYLTDVRVPDADRIGDVGDGWRVAMTTLMNERTTIGGGTGPAKKGSGPIAEAVRIFHEEAVNTGPEYLDKLMRAWIEAEVLRLTNIRASQNRRLGNPGPEGSIAKLMFAEVNQRVYELCLDLLGPSGQIGYEYTFGRSNAMGLVGKPGQSRQMFLRTRANSIEGGTSEIQRNIMGERVLGLPGEPRTDKEIPWAEVPRN